MLIPCHMMTFTITLLLTFLIMVFAMLWLSYSKRRQRHGKHGLTGMCHESGGTMCGSCAGTAMSRSPGACRGMPSAQEVEPAVSSAKIDTPEGHGRQG